jgi:uncharacterized protein YqjF (DUF2071 family)
LHWEFTELDHRPFSLPSSQWIMTQVWNDVLFMHWPVARDCIQSLLPRCLELDCYENTPWISFVLYNITNSRLRGFPPIPPFSSLPGLNIRTYVTYKGIPGIYFFSLDAPQLSAVLGAKWTTGLPYRFAKMNYKKEIDTIEFSSSFLGSRGEENFHVVYNPSSYMYEADPDNLDYWLLERYRMYSIRKEKLYHMDIHHDQWKVSDVKVDHLENSMAPYLPQETFLTQPNIHYSRRRQCFFYPLKKS